MIIVKVPYKCDTPFLDGLFYSSISKYLLTWRRTSHDIPTGSTFLSESILVFVEETLRCGVEGELWPTEFTD